MKPLKLSGNMRVIELDANRQAIVPELGDNDVLCGSCGEVSDIGALIGAVGSDVTDETGKDFCPRCGSRALPIKQVKFSTLAIGTNFLDANGCWYQKITAHRARVCETDSAYKAGAVNRIGADELVEIIKGAE